jgi:hypothetical protein
VFYKNLFIEIIVNFRNNTLALITNKKTLLILGSLKKIRSIMFNIIKALVFTLSLFIGGSANSAETCPIDKEQMDVQSAEDYEARLYCDQIYGYYACINAGCAWDEYMQRCYWW